MYSRNQSSWEDFVCTLYIKTFYIGDKISLSPVLLIKQGDCKENLYTRDLKYYIQYLNGIWIQYLYKAKSVLYSWLSSYLFPLFLGKLHWFNSRTCCCICWRSEKDASRENETTRAVNIGAIWKRSCCSCRHIQVLQSTCFFNCRFTPVSTSISYRSKWNSG